MDPTKEYLVQVKKTGKKFDEAKYFKYIPLWIADHDGEVAVRNMLLECEKDRQDTPYLKRFSQAKILTFIYTSNKLEATIPKGASEHATYKLLQDLLQHSNGEYIKPEPWFADGDPVSKKADKNQMSQHILAYKYLCSEDARSKALTPELILETHRLLMDGAIDEDKVPIAKGSYRTCAVFATGHVYPEFECIKPSMDKIIKEYNESTEHFIVKAAKLFYDVITLHPFVNGNGRICRLLLAYSLMKDGIPFPVSISAGHRKERNHYMNAIYRIREQNCYCALFQIVLASVQRSWFNYEENLKHIPNP
jgi:fido (protein-threonine AMPylation protein)